MKVLAAISDPELGRLVAEHLNNRVFKNGDVVHLVHVLSWVPSKKELESCPSLKDYVQNAEGEAKNLLHSFEDGLKQKLSGVEFVSSVLKGHAGEQLLVYAKNNVIDEIVVASHMRTELGQFFFGSVSKELLQYAPCTITVLRGRCEALAAGFA